MVFAFAGAALAQEPEPVEEEAFGTPVLIVSVGQSAGAQQAKVLAIKAGLDYVFEQRPDLSLLEEKQTLILVMGASSKGLGAAGVDIEGEIAWATDLVARARELEMTVIAMHIEGGARRGPTSDQIITALTPLADYIVVKGANPDIEWTESEEANANADGLFDTIAAEHEIAIAYIAKTLDGVGVLIDLFGIEATE
jgi:hypothetical protein